MGDVTNGHLLVSSPSMSDHNFDRTVIFMLEHTAEGAIGLILNRPSPIEVVEAIPLWAPLAADPRVVFVGGPVGQGSVIALARTDVEDDDHEDFTPILGSLGVLDVSKEPGDLSVGVEELRLFTGYAGWGPGQLDSELESGAWFRVDAEASDPLAEKPEDLWTDVLKRDEGRTAMATQDTNWLN